MCAFAAYPLICRSLTSKRSSYHFLRDLVWLLSVNLLSQYVSCPPPEFLRCIPSHVILIILSVSLRLTASTRSDILIKTGCVRARKIGRGPRASTASGTYGRRGLNSIFSYRAVVSHLLSCTTGQAGHEPKRWSDWCVSYTLYFSQPIFLHSLRDFFFFFLHAFATICSQEYYPSFEKIPFQCSSLPHTRHHHPTQVLSSPPSPLGRSDLTQPFEALH